MGDTLLEQQQKQQQHKALVTKAARNIKKTHWQQQAHDAQEAHNIQVARAHITGIVKKKHRGWWLPGCVRASKQAHGEHAGIKRDPAHVQRRV